MDAAAKVCMFVYVFICVCVCLHQRLLNTCDAHGFYVVTMFVVYNLYCVVLVIYVYCMLYDFTVCYTSVILQ